MIQFKGGRKYQGGWQAAIPAIIGAVGGIAGGLLGKSGQSSANAANLRIWREQRDWMTGMANSEVYRRKLDLERSGFNPMLSFMQGAGASTPSTQMPVMQNENASLAEGVANASVRAASAAQVKLIAAQTAAAAQQARKTGAEAAAIEAELPYSAQNAQMRSEQLKTSVSKTLADLEGQRLANLSADVALRELQPLAIQLQQLMVLGEKLGIAEKKALNDLYESVKGMKGLERIIPIITTMMRR